MVYLITGATHTGKTLLAQKLLEKYKYPYVSIDHIKMGLIRSENTKLTVEDDDQLTEYLWPIISEMLKTAIENRQNLIVEGCYVPGNWSEYFNECYLSEIKFVWLAMSDNYIDNNYEEILKHSMDIEKRIDDSNLNKELLKNENHKYIDAFNKYGENLIMIDKEYKIDILEGE